ncbi:MAG: hypothetical protein GW859_01975 [Sphingomonadales bacterium]|nr:hypothetical protein [Sphingomonadales bacterium]
MTISHSEIRRNARYSEISAFSFTSCEPDTVNFSISIGGVEELVELECDWTGTKTVIIYDEKSRRTPIDIKGPIFASWSGDLKRKISELLSELAEWEASMRKPMGAWDVRFLADPNFSHDTIPESESNE